MRSLKTLSPITVFTLGLLGAALWATGANGDKAVGDRVAYNAGSRTVPIPLGTGASAKDSGTYFFSAPPGTGHEADLAKYEPIAEHLSRVTGKRFVYQHADNWLSYSKNMASGAYDLVFDGPALNSWRMERISHAPLLKLADDMVFVVVTRNDNDRIGQLKQLAGHRVCAVPAPDAGALALLSQFDNPARQPTIAEAKDWQDAYQGLMAGKCSGSVIPRKTLDALNAADKVKVLYQHRALPNHAFSAGPRLSPDLKDKVRTALLTGSGKDATAKLRAAYGGGDFVPATPAEYAGLGKLLKNSLYYY
jgi:ABC-type phosphate/phosphonate transport system substrate-binding protein